MISDDLPNVLFILSDQHNAKVMRHEDHPDVSTPHLDRLASEGTRFSRAITQNPICTPSRICFLSGQYAHNHGYYGLSGCTPDRLPNVLQHFRKSGYLTAAIGKIHCPAHWVEDACDVFHDTCGSSIDGVSPEYELYLKERGLLELEDHVQFREFGARGIQTSDARPSQVDYADSQEGWSASKAIETMHQAAKQMKPFFIHVSLPKPHQNYAPAQPFWDLYDEMKLTLPPNTDYDMVGKAPHLKSMAQKWRSGDWTLFEPLTFAAGRRRKLHGYLGNISHIDQAVGDLLKGLDEAGLAQNTIVVYSSDHGDYACEHDIMEKAPGICSDAITRIPMIWRWPCSILAGQVSNAIVETVDVSTTLCRLAGLQSMPTSDGKDLTNLLHGEIAVPHEIGVTECVWSKSVRQGDYRFVYYPKTMFQSEYPDGFGELYDLSKDPWEMNNLYFEPEYQNRIQCMRQTLMDWLITTDRSITHHPPESELLDDESYSCYHNTYLGDGKAQPIDISKLYTMSYL